MNISKNNSLYQQEKSGEKEQANWVACRLQQIIIPWTF